MGEQIDLAVAAVHEEGQDVYRELLDGDFGGIEAFGIEFAGVFDERGILEANFAMGCQEAATVIAEGILKIFNGHQRIGVEFVGFAQVFSPRGMNVEQGDDGYLPDRLEMNVVAKANQHKSAKFSGGADEMQKIA